MISLSQYIFEKQIKEATIKLINNEVINDNHDFFDKFGEAFDKIYKEDTSKMYYVRYRKSVTQLYNKVKELCGEFFDTIKRFGVFDFITFSKFMLLNKDILIINYQLNNISFDIKEENKTQDNSENNIDDKYGDNSKYEEYDIVIYDREKPTNIKTSICFPIKFLKDDIEDQSEKEKLLKHKWKEITGINISQANIIKLENYKTKYKTNDLSKSLRKLKNSL